MPRYVHAYAHERACTHAYDVYITYHPAPADASAVGRAAVGGGACDDADRSVQLYLVHPASPGPGPGD